MTPPMTTEVDGPLACRHQVIQCILFEQRISACAENHVQVAALDQTSEHRALIHASADRLNGPLIAELVEGPVRARRRLLEMVVGIVQEQYVDPIDREPLRGSPQPIS